MMVQVTGILLFMKGTVEFLAPGFGFGPDLAVVGILGVDQ